MFRRCSVVIAVLLCVVVAQSAVNNTAQAAGKVRTWTNADGRTMEAEFVRELNGDVTFVKDGKLIVIRLDKLSLKDQQAVKDLSEGKEPADEDPFKTPEGKSASDSGSSTGGLFGDDKPNNSSGTDKPKKPISIQTRTWTDRFGNKSTGKFVRMNGNDVVMNRGTKPVSVPFFNLSDADQDYVREVLISQGKEDAIPSSEFAGGGTSEFGQGSAAPGVPLAGGSPGPGMGPGMTGMGPMGPGMGRGMGPGMSGMGPGMGRGMGPGMSGMGGMGPGMAGGPGGMSRGPGMGGGMRPPVGGTLGPGSMGGPGMAGGGVVGGPMGTGPVGGINSGPFDPSTAMAAGGMSGPGSMTSGMPATSMNPGMSSFPGSRMSNMPSMEPASIPPLPSTNFPSMEVEEYYQCSKCNARLSKLEVSGTSCPRCNTVWGFKQDAFGNKTMTTAGRGQVGAAGTIILVFVLLGVVVFISLFIGIIVAIVKAASANAAPPPQPMPTRYY